MRCRNLTNEHNVIFCNSGGLILPLRIELYANNTLQTSFLTASMTSDYTSASETYTDVSVSGLYVSCNKSKTNRLTFTYTSSYQIEVRYIFSSGDTVQTFYSSGNDVVVDEVWPCNRQIAQNYVVQQEYVKCALIQKLSIVKGELWFNQSFGLPLIDKAKTKSLFDVAVSKILANQKGILEVKSFKSIKEKFTYKTDLKLLTSFGELEMSTIR